MGGLHLCGCKGTKKIWIGQILAKESAEKVDFAVKIRKNSQLDAASWGKIVGKDSLHTESYSMSPYSIKFALALLTLLALSCKKSKMAYILCCLLTFWYF